MSERQFSLSDMYNMASDMFRFAKHFGEIGAEQNYSCKECGTELRITYLENRIYMVVCPCCESIRLVKATHPTNALKKVGNYSGYGKEDKKSCVATEGESE